MLLDRYKRPTINVALYGLFLFFSFIAFSQINEKGFSFQGYARDFEGTALGNQEITVRFSIYELGQTPTFVEEQTLQTDPFGLFGTTIGTVNQAGFFGIDWGNRNYSLQVEVRAFGADFIEVSNSPLVSVPYAQAAGNGVPPGTIMAFGGNIDKIPAGWLPCDGRPLDPNDPKLAPLFAVIDYNWGRDGAGRFRVPDLRGIFPRGVSQTVNDPDFASRSYLFTSGADIWGNDDRSGFLVGNYQFSENKAHDHDMSANGGHGHEIFKDPDLLSWYNDGGVFAPNIQHKVYDNVTGQSTGFIDITDFNNFDGRYPSGGGVDDHLLNSGLSGYHTEDVDNHVHDIFDRGGAESRPINAAVWYIIKL